MDFSNAQGVLLGYATVTVIAVVGYSLRRFGIFGPEAQATLNRLCYYVLSPALYIVLLTETDIELMLGAFTGASLLAMVIAMALAAICYLPQRRQLGADNMTLMIGSVAYANTGNIGIPLSLITFGTASYMVPPMLIQVLILSPVILLILGFLRGPRTSVWRSIVMPWINPIIIAAIVGLVMALNHWELPELLYRPIDMLGQASIPALVLTFGMSIFGARPFRKHEFTYSVWVAIIFKVLILPLITWWVGAALFQMQGEILVALVITAALPGAQSIFNYAMQFRANEGNIRDMVLISTVISIPIMVGFALIV